VTTVEVHGICTDLKFDIEAGEAKLCFEIEATTHAVGSKSSDNHSLFRYSTGSKSTAAAMRK
jgi:hypothetical protein